jgi:hypothetical protein
MTKQIIASELVSELGLEPHYCLAARVGLSAAIDGDGDADPTSTTFARVGALRACDGYQLGVALVPARRSPEKPAIASLSPSARGSSASPSAGYPTGVPPTRINVRGGYLAPTVYPKSCAPSVGKKRRFWGVDLRFWEPSLDALRRPQTPSRNPRFGAVRDQTPAFSSAVRADAA